MFFDRTAAVLSPTEGAALVIYLMVIDMKLDRCRSSGQAAEYGHQQRRDYAKPESNAPSPRGVMRKPNKRWTRCR